MVFNIIIYILAGLAAGVLTGFSGISAAVVVTPALVSLCGFNAYQAVGIAMASDVIASAATAWSYGKHGNLRMKSALPLMFIVLCFTIFGSWLGNIIPHQALGNVSVIMTPLMGLKFLIFPDSNLGNIFGKQTKAKLVVEIVVSGALIGTIAGFVGAGGGEMLLITLTTILAYDVKESVGTGVFIMAFIALVGCVSHIYIGGWPDTTALVICIAGNFIGAIAAARIADKISSATLNRIIGLSLVSVGLVMLAAHFI